MYYWYSCFIYLRSVDLAVYYYLCCFLFMFHVWIICVMNQRMFRVEEHLIDNISKLIIDCSLLMSSNWLKWCSAFNNFTSLLYLPKNLLMNSNVFLVYILYSSFPDYFWCAKDSFNDSLLTAITSALHLFESWWMFMLFWYPLYQLLFYWIF